MCTRTEVKKKPTNKLNINIDNMLTNSAIGSRLTNIIYIIYLHSSSSSSSSSMYITRNPVNLPLHIIYWIKICSRTSASRSPALQRLFYSITLYSEFIAANVSIKIPNSRTFIGGKHGKLTNLIMRCYILEQSQNN